MEETIDLLGVRVPKSATRLDSEDLPADARDQVLPKEIGELTKLTFMWLNNRNLSGTIPTEFAKLTSLTSLDLVNNNLHGEIPIEIGRLTALTRIRVVGNRLSGSLPRQLSQLTKLRVLDIQHNRFDLTCDCQLLSWYPDFVADNLIRATSDTCDPINANGGSYPHLIRATTKAPCSHVYLDAETSTATPSELHITWRYGMLTKELDTFMDSDDWRMPVNRSTFTSIDLGMMTSRFVHCSVFMSPNSTTSSTLTEGSNAGRGFGFRLRLSNESFSQERCLWSGNAAKTNTTDDGVFATSLTNLKPSADYEVTIEPFFMYFSYYVVDKEAKNLSWIANPVSYVYGPRSSRLQISTLPGIPTTSPRNVRVTSTTERELSLTWEDPSKFHSNGALESYEVHVKDAVSNVTYVHQSDARSITIRSGLTPESAYSIKVRGRTAHPVFGPFSNELQAKTCPENMRGDVKTLPECIAKPGYFHIPGRVASSAQACDTLPHGSLKPNSCLADGLTVKNLELHSGFWREGLESVRILPCPRKEYCLPLPSQSNESAFLNPNYYCTPRHQGVYCSDCQEGWVMGSKGCMLCTPAEVSHSVLSLGGTIAVFVIVLLLLFTNILRRVGLLSCIDPREEQHESSSTLRRLSRRISLNGSVRIERFHSALSSHASSRRRVLRLIRRLRRVKVNTKIRIMCGFFQVFFSFQHIFRSRSIDGVGAFQTVLDFMSSLNIVVLFRQMNMSCIWSSTHYNDLFLMTVLPIALASILKGMCVCLSFAYARLGRQIKYEFVSTALFIAFLVYPAVSQTIFETFWCERFPQADESILRTALRSDYTLSCEPSNERSIWLVYASMMVLVYPVGIVLVYVVVLLRFRSTLRADTVTDEEREELKMIYFLIKPYTREFYWFETYELLRKLSQTALLGLLQEITSSTFPVTLPLMAQNLCLLSVVILALASPYKERSDFWFALGSLLLLLPAAQLSVLDPTGEGLFDKSTATNVIILVELAMFVVVICLDGSFAFPAKIEVNEADDIEPLGSSREWQDKAAVNVVRNDETPSASDLARSVLVREVSSEVGDDFEALSSNQNVEDSLRFQEQARVCPEKLLVDEPRDAAPHKNLTHWKDSDTLTLLSEDFESDSFESEPDPEAVTDETLPIVLGEFDAESYSTLYGSSMHNNRFVIQ